MPAHLWYLQFSSVFCPWIPLLAVGAERAVNISCKHSFPPNSCTHGSYPVSDHTGCPWPIGNQSGWGEHWGNASIKTKMTQKTENGIIVFWSSSPAITWQLAMLNLWGQSVLHSGFLLPMWTKKLNKMSLEPNTLQDTVLFTGLFYALYVCWKTGLEIIESFKLEGILQIAFPNSPAQSRVTYSRLLKAVLGSWVLSISKFRGFTISMGNMFHGFKRNSQY